MTTTRFQQGERLLTDGGNWEVVFEAYADDGDALVRYVVGALGELGELVAVAAGDLWRA